jgi:hypothetical protein
MQSTRAHAKKELFYLLLKIYKTPGLLNELIRLPVARAGGGGAGQRASARALGDGGR